MSKNQFTGTETQPQRNRKLCQFDKDQYCMFVVSSIYSAKTVENALKENFIYNLGALIYVYKRFSIHNRKNRIIVQQDWTTRYGYHRGLNGPPLTYRF